MSHVSRQISRFKELDVLREALQLAGFTPVFQQDYKHVALQGYYGTSTFNAQLGVTRTDFEKVMGDSSYADLGWNQTQEGSLELQADSMVLRTRQWEAAQKKLTDAYAEVEGTRRMYSEGWGVSSRTVEPDGTVSLEFQPLY